MFLSGDCWPDLGSHAADWRGGGIALAFSIRYPYLGLSSCIESLHCSILCLLTPATSNW
jgi:hypothetical protein